LNPLRRDLRLEKGFKKVFREGKLSLERKVIKIVRQSDGLQKAREERAFYSRGRVSGLGIEGREPEAKTATRKT